MDARAVPLCHNSSGGRMKYVHEGFRDALIVAALILISVTSVAIIRTMGAMERVAERADDDLQHIEREALNHSDNALRIETAAEQQISGLRADVLKRVDDALKEVLQLAKDRSAEILTLAKQTKTDA